MSPSESTFPDLGITQEEEDITTFRHDTQLPNGYCYNCFTVIVGGDGYCGACGTSTGDIYSTTMTPTIPLR